MKKLGGISIKCGKEDNACDFLKPLPIILLIFCTWILLKIVLEFPYPSADVFIFKDPGANLFFKHGFFAENLPYTSGEKLIHFMQGYFYPLLYGLWTLVAGFGIKRAILFDSIIDLLRFALTYTLLSYAISGIKRIKTALPFLLLLPLLFTFFDHDRSDALAACLTLANFILIAKFQRDNRRSLIAIAAALAALCLFTAPAIGLFTLLISLWCLWGITRRPRICLMYVSVFAACSLLQISAFLLFSPKSLIRLVGFYNHFYSEGGNTFAEFLWRCWRHSFNITPVSRAVHLLLYMQIAINLIALKSSRRLSSKSYDLRLANKLFIGALACVPLSYVLFPWQHNYLVFLGYLFIIYSIIIYALLPQTKAKTLLSILLFLNFALPAGVSAQRFIEALTRPKNQSSHFIAQKIYSIIPLGEKIATVPTYYYILKRNYGPADINFLPKDSLLSYRYILTGGCGTGKPGDVFMPSQYSSKEVLLKDYEVVFDYLNRTATYLFGIRITRSAYGFGGLLLKKKSY